MLAQNAPLPPRPQLTQPGPVPLPVPAAAAPAPPAPSVTGASMTRLQFPNTDVKEVLSFYERLTKKRLVLDNQVQGTLNIVVAGEVPIEEAVRIIEISLLLNGFTLVPAETSNIVKVIGAGKSPRSAAIPIISDELLLPEGEQVVTFVVKLQYGDPAELAQTLGTFIAQAPGNFTNVTALPKSQTILITENTATIRGLLRIIREIDVPPAEVISEFIPLERADAKDVLDKLTGIFEKQPNQAAGTTARPAQRQPGALPNAGQPGVPQAPAGVTAEVTSPGTLELRGGTLSEDSIIVGRIKLTADVRTNRIHVVTRPVNMPFVRKLISEFDSTATFGEPVSRPLRFISVGDVLDVIVKSISEPGMKEEGGGSSGSAPRPGGQSSAQNSGGAGGFGGGGDSSGGTGGTSFNVSEGLSTEAVDTTPEARVIGTTKIIADKNANSIIIIGGADVRAKIFSLLDFLDQRIPQVMLHTVIGELNLNAKEQFGVEYVLRTSGLGGLVPLAVNSGNVNNAVSTGNDGTGTGTSTSTTNTTTTTGTTGTTTVTRASDLVDVSNGRGVLNFNNLLNRGVTGAVAAAGAGGLSGFVTAGNSMTAIVSALEDTNRFRVVSRPSVFTRNNKKAIIASGQEIAVPVNIQSSVNSVTAGNAGLVTNSSVQFKRVALQLEVVPLINSEREVSLDILQKVDEVAGSTRIDNNDIPNIATRYVKTSVTVPNEGTLVLGGLIKQSESRSRSGIPFLSNIPVLGYLFSGTSKEKIRTELVILIRPLVSWAPPESIQIRERAQEFMNMDPDLEASIFPAGVRKAAAVERPFSTPAPAKRPPTPKARPYKAATPVPAKRASANLR